MLRIFFGGDRHQRISDYLPALTPEQRLDGRKLGRDALESLPADIAISAGTLGAVKVGAPYVVEAGKPNFIPERTQNVLKSPRPRPHQISER